MDDLDSLIKEHIEQTVSAQEVPAEVLRKAKDLMGRRISCPHCGRAITPFKKPHSRQMLVNLLWLASAASMFLLSFVFPHYFFQFLVLTLLAGFKWIVEQRSSKTQILIYKALKEEESGSRLKDLHKSPSRL